MVHPAAMATRVPEDAVTTQVTRGSSAGRAGTGIVGRGDVDATALMVALVERVRAHLDELASERCEL